MLFCLISDWVNTSSYSPRNVPCHILGSLKCSLILTTRHRKIYSACCMLRPNTAATVSSLILWSNKTTPTSSTNKVYYQVLYCYYYKMIFYHILYTILVCLGQKHTHSPHQCKKPSNLTLSHQQSLAPCGCRCIQTVIG